MLPVTPSFHVIVECIAFFAACLFGRYGERYFLLFIPFLLYTCINEYIGCFYRDFLHMRNVTLYNIYTPIQFVFFALLIWSALRGRIRRFITMLLLMAGVTFSVYNIIYLQGLNVVLNTYSNLIFSLLLITMSMLYLYDLLTINEPIATPVRMPMFWVVAGILFFNFGWPVINALYHSCAEIRLYGKAIYNRIMIPLNLLMYSCFTISFILCKSRKSIF